MKPKKQNGITKAKRRVNLALFNLFDFIMSKLDKIKNKKNVRNFFFPFCFLLLFALPVSADYTVDQQAQTGSFYANSGGGTAIAQSFIPTKNNINRVELICAMDYGQYAPAFTLNICKGVPLNEAYTVAGSYTSCAGPGNSVLKTLTNQTIYCNYGGSPQSYNFATIGLTSGYHYFFEIVATSTIPNKAFYTWVNSPYTNGQAYSTQINGASNYDIYFKTYYDSTIVGAVLNIDTPVNKQIITQNSAVKFVGTVQNGNGLAIKVGGPNQSPGVDVFGVSFESGYTYYYDVTKTLTNGEYWVWYYVTKGTTTQISTTTLYVEVLGTGKLKRTIKMDEATICAGIDKTTFFGGIECGFKKVLAWAIYPSDEMTTDLQVSYDDFKTAFPFNAFYGLTDTITDTMASTTVNRNGHFDVPMINKQGDIITLPVVSSSSMARAVGQTNADLIRNTMTWAMWLGFAFIVFIQFKKF